MKLPSYRELSTEQDKIYNLPLTSNYLISGPPGTGKTVIALYRASMYEKQQQTPILLTYSKLLSSYIGNAADELDIDGIIFTYHSWVSTTYRELFNENPPQTSPFVYDWPSMTLRLLDQMMTDKPCLLIDEGQDLPPDFYLAASLLSRNLTVFADENQRITETQSTFAEIRGNGGIETEHKLTRNYRNSKQIARVAACFYAGMPGGIPDLPKREGPLPVVQNTADLNEAVDLISRFEQNNNHLQIGVFTKSIDFQRTLLQRFEGKTRNPVEYYNSRAGAIPSFDTAGIKLISYASAKGLEFDAVFLPELQSINMNMEMKENKMVFYVLLSRAREYLYMLYSGAGRPPLFNLIADELVEYR